MHNEGTRPVVKRHGVDNTANALLDGTDVPLHFRDMLILIAGVELNTKAGKAVLKRNKDGVRIRVNKRNTEATLRIDTEDTFESIKDSVRGGIGEVLDRPEAQVFGGGDKKLDLVDNHEVNTEGHSTILGKDPIRKLHRDINHPLGRPLDGLALKNALIRTKDIFGGEDILLLKRTVGNEVVFEPVDEILSGRTTDSLLKTTGSEGTRVVFIGIFRSFIGYSGKEGDVGSEARVRGGVAVIESTVLAMEYPGPPGGGVENLEGAAVGSVISDLKAFVFGLAHGDNVSNAIRVIPHVTKTREVAH